VKTHQITLIAYDNPSSRCPVWLAVCDGQTGMVRLQGTVRQHLFGNPLTGGREMNFILALFLDDKFAASVISAMGHIKLNC